MRYLPILGELFSSDTLIIFAIGLVPLFFGCRNKKCGTNLKAALICFGVYAVCEALSNIRTNYMAELILLFAGSAALGGAVGAVCAAVYGKKTNTEVSDNE